MNRSTWIRLAACALLAVLLFMPAASATSLPAGARFEITWLQAVYKSGSAPAPLPYTILPDGTMQVKPEKNYQTAQQFQLLFSYGGSDQNFLAPGTVQMRLPRSIFVDAAGTQLGTINLGIPKAPQTGIDTEFHYYEDGDEIVITNFATITEATFFSTKIEYVIGPPLVPVDTPNPYVSGPFNAELYLKSGPDEPYVLTRESNQLALEYWTDAKLKSIAKIGYSLAGWDAALMGAPAPADSADYFYVLWRVYLTEGPNNTQGYNVVYTDINLTPGAQVYAWRAYPLNPNVPITLSDLTSPVDTFEQFRLNMEDRFRRASPYPYEYPTTLELYVRYPRSLLTQPDPNDPLYRRATARNRATADLVGDFGAADSRTHEALYVYEERAWKVPIGPTLTKSNYYYKSSGMLNRLEEAASADTSLKLFPNSTYDWTVTSSDQAWGRTLQDGQYGVLEWTAYHQDNKLSFNAERPGRMYYDRLEEGDYAITRLNLFRPEEKIYGEPTLLGTNTAIPQDLSKYGTVTVQASTLLDPASDADWTDLGVIHVLPSGQWTFTSTSGTVTTLDAAAVHSLDLRALFPGQDVLSVRMVQKTRSGIAQMKYSIKTELYPSADVLHGLLEPSTGYVDQRPQVTLYNRAETWSEGGAIEQVYAGDAVAYTWLTRYDGQTRLQKSQRLLRSEPALGRELVEVTLEMVDSVDPPASTTLQEVIDAGMLTEQKNGVFYDLLPPGASMDPASIRAFRYAANNTTYYGAPRTLELIPNFRNSGRTLVIIRLQVPPNVQNYYKPEVTASSGFRVSFTMINTWQNILDNGNVTTNYVGYNSTDGFLWKGVSDQAPAGWPPDVQAAYLDINGDGSENPREFVYSQSSFTFAPLDAMQAGFSKLVKAADETRFTTSTRVPGGGTYMYQLRLVSFPNTSTTGIVFYDSMEDMPPEGTPSWRGTPLSFDLYNAMVTHGVDVGIYYTLRRVNPKANPAADGLLQADGSINTATWTHLPIGAPLPDPGEGYISFAFDLRYTDQETKTPFVLEPEQAISLQILMTAPVDTAPYLPPAADPEILAWNNAYVEIDSQLGGETVRAVENVSPVTVALRPVDLTITKASSPGSGYPVQREQNITYYLTLRNVNRVEAITDIVMEDLIPEGLLYDAADFRYYRNAEYNTLRPLPPPGTPGAEVTLEMDGRNLIFRVPKLLANSYLTFIIYTKTPIAEEVTNKLFENTAVITQAFSEETEIKSNTVTHELLEDWVTLTGFKRLEGRELSEQDVFYFQLFDARYPNSPLQTVRNTGATNDAFVFRPLFFTAAGTYRYYITEFQGILDSIAYDTRRVDVTVTVTRVWAGDRYIFKAMPAYSVGGVPIAKEEIGFTNVYETTSYLTRKRWVHVNPKGHPSLQLQLYRDGLPYGTPVITEAGGITGYLWENLPKWQAGVQPRQLSVYQSVEEHIPADYHMYVEADGIIVNVYQPGTFSATKYWDGPPAQEVQFNLYRTVLDDPYEPPYREWVDTVTLRGESKPPAQVSGEYQPWTYTWFNLPAAGEITRVIDGVPLTQTVAFEYEIAEETVPVNYELDTVTMASTSMRNYAQLRDFTAYKRWLGGPQGDVQLRLKRDGEFVGEPVPLKKGETSYTWSGLPRYSNWEERLEYAYSFEEVSNIENYTVTYSILNGLPMATNVYVIPTTDLSVQKAWEGGPNTAREVLLQLKQDGVNLGQAVLTSGLTHTWKALDLTDGDGKPHVYTVQELNVPEGYRFEPGEWEAGETGLKMTVRNIYAPAYDSIHVEIPAVKRLSGRTLKEGTFTFTLTDHAGKVLQRVQNALDGSIPFEPRRFSRTGIFLYTISEEAGEETDIRYDATEYTIRITVTAANGSLSHKLDVLKDGVPQAGKAVFENRVDPPKTGDIRGRAILLTGLAAIAALGVRLGLKRRKNKAKG